MPDVIPSVTMSNDPADSSPTRTSAFDSMWPFPDPASETDYPVPLQGTGVTGNANWHVKIEFVAPP